MAAHQKCSFRIDSGCRNDLRLGAEFDGTERYGGGVRHLRGL